MNRLSSSRDSREKLHISIDTDVPSPYMGKLLISGGYISPDSEELGPLLHVVTGLAQVVSPSRNDEICFHYKIQGRQYLRFDARNFGRGWRITATRLTPLK